MESQLTSMEKIEDPQIDSLIWTDPDSQLQNEQLPSFQIYTVSKSIKNPKILEHIKPDYGSLGDFMKNVGISKDILLHNRKKKNEQQEDIQQKKLRSNLKDKNLDKILKQENSSHLEKAVASKMIVENLFQGQFGMGLNYFCTQNNKTENNKHSYLSIGELADTLDDLMVQKKDSQIQFESRNDIPTLTRQKQMMSNKQIRSLNFSERKDKIKKLQQNYSSLKRNSIGMDSMDTKAPFSQGTLHFQNCILNINSLYSQLVSVDIENIKCLKLTKVSISDDLLSLLLDYFTFLDSGIVGLRQLIIEKCIFTNMNKIAQRLKKFIEETNVMRVALSSSNIGNRDFCIISLGIGARSHFQYLGLRGNQITEVARKCVDVLLKFHKQTSFDLSGNPIQREIKGKSGYVRCFK